MKRLRACITCTAPDRGSGAHDQRLELDDPVGVALDQPTQAELARCGDLFESHKFSVGRPLVIEVPRVTPTREKARHGNVRRARAMQLDETAGQRNEPDT